MSVLSTFVYTILQRLQNKNTVEKKITKQETHIWAVTVSTESTHLNSTSEELQLQSLQPTGPDQKITFLLLV